MKFKELLVSKRACYAARQWVGNRTIEQAWAECERANWMMWLLGRMAGTPGWPTCQQVNMMSCGCAYAAAAYAAADAAAAADAVADAAAAEAAAEAAADAAAAAAAADDAYAYADAGDYLYAADAAAFAAAKTKRLRELADLIRPLFTPNSAAIGLEV